MPTPRKNNNVTFLPSAQRPPEAAPPDDPRVRIEWRLLQVMAERRIKRNTELVRLLSDVGVAISTTQLGRMVDRCPERLNTETLRGLLTVLRCEIGDLIRVHPARGAPRD